MTIEVYFQAELANLLGALGFHWMPRFKCFVAASAPGCIGRIFVTVARHRDGAASVSFPAHVRFDAVEVIRATNREWPSSLSVSSIARATGMSASAVQAYPKELGTASVLAIRPGDPLEPYLDSAKRIVQVQSEWIERFSDLDVLRCALESSSPADWPIPLPIQRWEILIAIYAAAGETERFSSIRNLIGLVKSVNERTSANQFLERVEMSLGRGQ